MFKNLLLKKYNIILSNPTMSASSHFHILNITETFFHFLQLFIIHLTTKLSLICLDLG